MSAKRKQIIKAARLFLMWFDTDGTPVDGFRFQEQRRALADAVTFDKWWDRKFNRKKKARKR